MTASELENLRCDYITSAFSVRQLAQKYGMSKSALDRLVKKQGWNIERKAIEDAATEIAHESTPIEFEEDGTELGTVSGQMRDNLARRKELLYSTADELLKLTRAMLKTSTAMAPRDLQAMSSTLMNIKQIHDIRPETEDESKAKSIEVKLEGPLDEWAG